MVDCDLMKNHSHLYGLNRNNLSKNKTDSTISLCYNGVEKKEKEERYHG